MHNDKRKMRAAAYDESIYMSGMRLDTCGIEV